MATRKQRIQFTLPEGSQPSAADVRWVALGAIVGCHGLRGELRVKQYNLDSDLLPLLEQIALRQDGSLRLHTVQGVRSGSKGPLLQLVGVDTIEAAETLRGAELCVPRTALPAPAHGEFYYVDLEGLRVVLPDGSLVGEVERVCDYPASRTLRVIAAAAIWEVPMIEPYLVSIDVEAQQIVVDHLADLEPERKA